MDKNNEDLTACLVWMLAGLLAAVLPLPLLYLYWWLGGEISRGNALMLCTIAGLLAALIGFRAPRDRVLSGLVGMAIGCVCGGPLPYFLHYIAPILDQAGVSDWLFCPPVLIALSAIYFFGASLLIFPDFRTDVIVLAYKVAGVAIIAVGLLTSWVIFLVGMPMRRLFWNWWVKRDQRTRQAKDAKREKPRGPVTFGDAKDADKDEALAAAGKSNVVKFRKKYRI